MAEKESIGNINKCLCVVCGSVHSTKETVDVGYRVRAFDVKIGPLLGFIYTKFDLYLITLSSYSDT